MAKITAGNALYLYRLLGRELGMGKQTSMARAAEVLEADGIWPEDLGCADVRALCEALTDFTKVTAFKKGQVFVTVMRNEELDRMLERAGEPTAAEKAASKGKPWKHRKGAKAVKPQKPRHVEKPATVEPVVEPVVDPAPDSVTRTHARTCDRASCGGRAPGRGRCGEYHRGGVHFRAGHQGRGGV